MDHFYCRIGGLNLPVWHFASLPPLNGQRAFVVALLSAPASRQAIKVVATYLKVIVEKR